MKNDCCELNWYDAADNNRNADQTQENIHRDGPTGAVPVVVAAVIAVIIIYTKKIQKKHG